MTEKQEEQQQQREDDYWRKRLRDLEKGKNLVIEYTKNHFEVVKSVDWSDVIDKIGFEFKNETVNFVAKDPKTPPTFALHSNYYPGSILKAFDEVKAELGVAEMHIYTSFGNNSSTYGRHKDTMNV